MPIVEEGIVLHDDVLECTAFLQYCFQCLEAGNETLITGDPFYERADGKPALTEEDIDKVVDAIDQEFAAEISSYPGYHRNRSGATHTPDFFRLGPAARRAMVEGLDAILTRHRKEKEAAAQAAREAAAARSPLVNADAPGGPAYSSNTWESDYSD